VNAQFRDKFGMKGHNHLLVILGRRGPGDQYRAIQFQTKRFALGLF
jgi:hypothetical protein